MKIDYDRLILLLLPLRIRTVRLVSLLRVLISPIILMHDTFHTWAEKRRLRAAATPQALMLERLVLSETGLSVQILPVETGASPDFEVKHPDNASAADVEAARSVIDRYKLAGKSYRVVGSVVPFTIAWSDFLCAVAYNAAEETQEWNDMVCAVISTNRPVNQIRVSQRGFDYRLYSNQPVTSDITVTIEFTQDASMGSQVGSVTGIIYAGQYEVGLTTMSYVQSYRCIEGPTPSSDANFTYEIVI